VIVLLAVGLIGEFRDYFYALLRREFEGNEAEFIGFKVHLPLFWFKNHGQLFGEEFIGRAYPSYRAGDPVITALPISRGVKNTDSEVLRSRQNTLSSLSKELEEFKGASVVDIHSKAMTLYCIKSSLGPSLVDLSCNAAKVPYKLDYTGPSTLEPEAEAIFTSFE